MVFNATFNNISAISWQSVLLVEETVVPREHHWPVTSHWQTLSHNVEHLAINGVRTHTQFEIIKPKSTNKNTDLKSIIKLFSARNLILNHKKKDFRIKQESH